MSRSATLPLTHSLNCTRCGYDQRGLPVGSRCPECGTRFVAGTGLAEINQWSERTILNLWSICVMQSIGGACLLIGLIATSLGQPAAIPIVLTSSAYVIAATVSYIVTLALVVRRRRRANYANMTPSRRASLRAWLVVDGLLCLAPIAVVWTVLRF